MFELTILNYMLLQRNLTVFSASKNLGSVIKKLKKIFLCHGYTRS